MVLNKAEAGAKLGVLAGEASIDRLWGLLALLARRWVQPGLQCACANRRRWLGASFFKLDWRWGCMAATSTRCKAGTDLIDHRRPTAAGPLVSSAAQSRRNWARGETEWYGDTTIAKLSRRLEPLQPCSGHPSWQSRMDPKARPLKTTEEDRSPDK